MTTATETRLGARNDISQEKFSMLDRLVSAFYCADSTENCGIFFSYDRELKLNNCDFFVIFSVALSVDYDT